MKCDPDQRPDQHAVVLDFGATSITPVELEFLIARKLQVEDVARAFAVPPYLLGKRRESIFE